MLRIAVSPLRLRLQAWTCAWLLASAALGCQRAPEPEVFQPQMGPLLPKGQAPIDPQIAREALRHNHLGIGYWELDDAEKAGEHFQKVAELAPGEDVGHTNLAVVLVHLNKLSEAAESADQALRARPDRYQNHLLAAKLAREQAISAADEMQATRALQQADEHIARAIELAPESLQVWYAVFEHRSSHLPPFGESTPEVYAALQQAIPLAPRNVVLRVKALQHAMILKRFDDAREHATVLADLVKDIEDDMTQKVADLVEQLKADDPQVSPAQGLLVENFLRAQLVYREALNDLKPHIYDLFLQEFSPEFYEALPPESRSEAQVKFRIEPLPVNPEESPARQLRPVDIDDDGDTDLVLAGEKGLRVLRRDGQEYQDATADMGFDITEPVSWVTLADMNYDRRWDLVVGVAGRVRYWQQEESGKFADRTTGSGLEEHQEVIGSLAVDYDHEGDLDLVLFTPAGVRFSVNHRDGEFSDRTEQSQVTGDWSVTCAEFGDFDNDRDLDLVLGTNQGPVLLANERQGRFRDITAEAQLPKDRPVGAVAVGDVNHDGLEDILVGWSDESGGAALLINRGENRFEASSDWAGADGLAVASIVILDFDNDGYLDFALGGRAEQGRSVRLHQNTGTGFDDVSDLLPTLESAAQHLESADIDSDGDLDLSVATADGRSHLLINEGGNTNHWIQVRLVSFSNEENKQPDAKNNRLGIGARLELKAGKRYQLQLVRNGVPHFGLGQRQGADAIRLVWPNGVPQTIIEPTADQVIDEKQMQKGSCPFLYAWNGSRFEFVTDLAWASPLGLRVNETQHAFFDSDEHVRITGDQLQPIDGRYVLQITEELWELAYFDEVKLLVLDHPADVEIFSNQKIQPPPFPEHRIHALRDANRRDLVASRDHRGRDVLSWISRRDERYLKCFEDAPYQGTAEPWELVLDLGDLRDAPRIRLVMTGWHFPGDTSLNVAQAQDSRYSWSPPSLSVPDGQGGWKTVMPWMGFVPGKTKTIVHELTGLFEGDDFRVKIAGTGCDYWDEIYAAVDAQDAPVRVTRLSPISANLHYRGFSQIYRRGVNGPDWFDYNDCDPQPHWSDPTGLVTRYGDVTPLLQKADDFFVILNAGDEMTVIFDARSVPEPPSGWSRSFLLYDVAWDKDCDLNTTAGQTVEPLPFNSMQEYPPRRPYPDTPAHREFLRQYNTRTIGPERFNDLLRTAAEAEAKQIRDQ